jgi:hypothetical protein
MTGALDELCEEIDSLAAMARGVFSASVADHIEAARAHAAAGNPHAAQVSLEIARELMDAEHEHPTEWWRRA